MPWRPFTRDQGWLLPPTLDELLSDDHPARFVAAFVDNLDHDVWAELNIDLDGEEVGAPAYHPRALLSVWLYGFTTGVRSSRKLEGVCRDQLRYLWLVERLWRSVKYEEVYLRAYESVSEARAGLSRYFEFYNTRRPQSSLGGMTPDQFYHNWLPKPVAA